ncbi:glycosyltransferase family 117 protein [Rhodothermus profundi]|uniref:DUF2723 domain-containing protein n=1 Tax=Rhodothermus profundi TaxID=633813 RepID=A0A1M6TRN7_9BACT|nr:DUF2723 domain-containing protein [Rhodothermus profundi]SHK59508.1 Protein of unknown function [Rhodothermus profundi]
MRRTLIERLVATAVFLYALVLYGLTIAPTVSFWDSGEFIASVFGLEVMHPPGAPFYMLVARLFSMLAPSRELVALTVNWVSALSSAVTVLLTHLIIVRLIRHWQPPADKRSWTDDFIALAGGVVGACTFAVTDSFWFNAVEAEVYALSMLFTALVVWLGLRWSEQATLEVATLRRGGTLSGLAANRYLVLIAYLFGLAIGVHLLSLLALFFVALLVFFTEFERPEWTPTQRGLRILGALVVSALIFLAIYPGIIQELPNWAGKSGDPLLFGLTVLALVVAGVYYTHRQRKPAANLAMLCLAMILLGYSSYALIIIRSSVDPPIDLNDPETPQAFVSYLKREQYGETPLLRGATYNNQTGQIDPSRTVLFPRRWSPDPNHLRVYAQYSSDLDFFLRYQLGHMYVRYFLWNFVGKASDVQDAPAITGFLPGEKDLYFFQTPSERAARNVYYALPLLLGLLGMAFHFNRDWRRAFSVLILFLVTGVGIILYLNQTPLQPRERDYSYVGSFFAFSLWVGIGAAGLLELVRDRLKNQSSALQRFLLGGTATVIFAAVPLHMLLQNYDDHDRSGRYVARDYAWNLLMSLDENAIVFTNGDNDTYPLWYLQEVEGVRQDVRVANLSLLNTSWYIKQLKHQWARKSAPLPISLSDAQIDRLSVVPWNPREIELPVRLNPATEYERLGIAPEDSSRVMRPMRWRLEGRPYARDLRLLYAADIAVLDMLRSNAENNWERPIYFAVTVSPDGQLNLQNFFQLEGQAYRVVPIRHNVTLGRVVPSITLERLQRFRFTNLDNPNVYFDENIRRMVDNYRSIFAHIAVQLAEQGLAAKGEALLDTLMVRVPLETIPADLRSYYFLTQAYQQVGATEKAVAIWKKAEPLVLFTLRTARSQREADLAAQFVQIIRFTYMMAGDYEAAAAFSNRLAEVLGDDSFRKTPEELRREMEESLSAPSRNDS